MHPILHMMISPTFHGTVNTLYQNQPSVSIINLFSPYGLLFGWLFVFARLACLISPLCTIVITLIPICNNSTSRLTFKALKQVPHQCNLTTIYFLPITALQILTALLQYQPFCYQKSLPREANFTRTATLLRLLEHGLT